MRVLLQVARNGIDLGADCSNPAIVMAVAEEMDRMLMTFLQWANHVVSSLSRKGYWADAVDPRLVDLRTAMTFAAHDYSCHAVSFE